ncbi:MAG: imidazole glycerol phosphate synthase subunit HisH [Candidatus Omnitrophica bacterium]|nr:imidazole glycerol phosphate synthase subunit HisH [Candidatus Omnitrophota bacterium]MCG2711252.1 imidazole glycerol phosphate synthase subunit HisH [Candidatus Omnitrophota bacterium]
MICIIDYKMGNVASVAKAFELVGARVLVTADKRKLHKAKALILPGVGAFAAGMRNLRELRLIPEIRAAVNECKPFMGICLGMQLLFTTSEEHGKHNGLNIIPGNVIRFRSDLKIPHMGWNTITQAAGRKPQDAGLLKGVKQGSYFYFVHSYYVKPLKQSGVLAVSEYGQRFAAIVAKGNTFGIQFHPEKSSDLGLKILENFCKMAGEIR